MDKQAFRNNSFNTFRLLASLSVLYGHVMKHLSISGGGIFSFFDILHKATMGVPLFFCISGYLVWNSVKMSQYSKQYFSKRFLRIYPELWIAVVLELVTILLFYNERINPVGLSAFAVTQGTFLQFWTPDFLRGYGCGTPNGSLWTISIIVQFYIVIWFARKLLQNRKPFFWGLLFVVSVVVGWMSNYLQHFVPEIAYKLFCQTLVPYLWLFVLGVIACEYSDRVIPLLKKYWVVSLLLYILLRFPFCNVDISVCDYPLCGCILMMMAVIGLSYAFPSINIKKDISYGIYIYHMIVVNVMIQLRMVEKPYYLLLVIAVTVGLAIASSWIVGKITKIVQDYKVLG